MTLGGEASIQINNLAEAKASVTTYQEKRKTKVEVDKDVGFGPKIPGEEVRS
jgi:hypothetical protein